ncbi:MAG TPA: SAM-dependent methyltransferase [Mycobacteriales bacterium]|nr:SAM-dependent methyltransferase [Mycobacteriales bacterium]
MTFRPWREATESALYGPDGFYLRETVAAHFRTSVTSSVAFVHAIRRLAGLVDEALGWPDPFDVVDVGAADGALLEALPDVPPRWRLTGVDVAPDPGIAARWSSAIPAVTGLLFANEWLDNVPLDVVESGRLVLVDTDGTERLGPSSPYDAWVRRWWPAGDRVEVGLPRDRAWSDAVSQVSRGLAVAIDYGHTLPDRRPTLTGYRHGLQVPPVPDGTCDITAHVALDSVAAATGARLMTQRDALRHLGVSGQLPAYEGDGSGYALALQRASDSGVLLDPAGLGGFGWVVQEVGISLPWLSGAGRDDESRG